MLSYRERRLAEERLELDKPVLFLKKTILKTWPVSLKPPVAQVVLMLKLIIWFGTCAEFRISSADTEVPTLF